MNKLKSLVLTAVFVAFSPIDSYGLGPVDGEIGIALWNNEFNADLSDGEIDAGSLMLYGEAWLGDKWGLSGAWFDSDLESTEFSDQSRLQIEIRRRLLIASDNNFIALGTGLEKIELENGSNSNGLSLSAEGRLGLPGTVYFYGKYSWVPVLQDAANFVDVSAKEFEAGVHFTPFPFVSVRVGYLEYDLNYTDSARGAASGSNTSGFYLGAGMHW